MSRSRPKAAFLSPRDPVVRNAWTDLLQRTDQRTPFSTLAYADALCSVLDHTYRLAGVWDEQERLCAGLLLFERQRGPYRMVEVPPLTPYTPFLFDPPLRESDINHRRSALDALLALLVQRYHRLAFHLHPTTADVRAYQWSGWDAQPLYTHRQRTVDRATLLRQASRNVRRQITGEMDRYCVHEAPDAVPALVALVEKTYADLDRPPPIAAEPLAAVIRMLQRKGLARLFTAARTERAAPEGALLILSDGYAACEWVVGSEPGPARTLLLGAVLPQLHEEGIVYYDFVGANIPSVAEFKRRFGAPLVPYYRVERCTRLELRLVHFFRQLTA